MLPDAMSTTFLVDLPMAPTGPVTQRSPHVFWPVSYCKRFGFSFINPLHILRGLTGSSARLWKDHDGGMWLILVGSQFQLGLSRNKAETHLSVVAEVSIHVMLGSVSLTRGFDGPT